MQNKLYIFRRVKSFGAFVIVTKLQELFEGFSVSNMISTVAYSYTDSHLIDRDRTIFLLVNHLQPEDGNMNHPVHISSGCRADGSK